MEDRKLLAFVYYLDESDPDVAILGRKHEMKSARRKTHTDLVLLGLFAVCDYVFGLLTEAHEWLERWAVRHEE